MHNQTVGVIVTSVIVFFCFNVYGMKLFVAHQTLCITGFNFETESLVVCVCISLYVL